MRNQSTKTERNQWSDDAKQTTNGAGADRDVFFGLPNRLMGGPVSPTIFDRHTLLEKGSVPNTWKTHHTFPDGL